MALSSYGKTDTSGTVRILMDLREAIEGQHVLIERRATRTIARLAARGYQPVPVDTSEFLKSGGSNGDSDDDGVGDVEGTGPNNMGAAFNFNLLHHEPLTGGVPRPGVNSRNP